LRTFLEGAFEAQWVYGNPIANPARFHESFLWPIIDLDRGFTPPGSTLAWLKANLTTLFPFGRMGFKEAGGQSPSRGLASCLVGLRVRECKGRHTPYKYWPLRTKGTPAQIQRSIISSRSSLFLGNKLKSVPKVCVAFPADPILAICGREPFLNAIRLFVCTKVRPAKCTMIMIPIVPWRFIGPKKECGPSQIFFLP